MPANPLKRGLDALHAAMASVVESGGQPET